MICPLKEGQDYTSEALEMSRIIEEIGRLTRERDLILSVGKPNSSLKKHVEGREEAIKEERIRLSMVEASIPEGADLLASILLVMSEPADSWAHELKCMFQRQTTKKWGGENG